MCSTTHPSTWDYLVALALEKTSAEVTESVAVFKSELEQPIAPRQLELSADVGPMGLHRARADKKFGGNFLRCLSLGNALEHAPFRHRQVVEARALTGEQVSLASAPQK